MAWFTKFYPETTVVTNNATCEIRSEQRFTQLSNSAPASRVLIDDEDTPSYDFQWEVCGKWSFLNQDACLNVTSFSVLGDAGDGTSVLAGSVGTGAKRAEPNRARTTRARRSCTATVFLRAVIARAR
jgi:hypothetical protein